MTPVPRLAAGAIVDGGLFGSGVVLCEDRVEGGDAEGTGAKSNRDGGGGDELVHGATPCRLVVSDL